MTEKSNEQNTTKITDLGNKLEYIPTIAEPSNKFKDFTEQYRIATQLAKSSIIPQTFAGKPENVIIALELAQKLRTRLLHRYAKFEYNKR